MDLYCCISLILFLAGLIITFLLNKKFPSFSPITGLIAATASAICLLYWGVFFTEDDRLVLQTFDSVCIFRKEDWKPAGFVPSVLARLPQRDEFLTRYKVSDGYQIYPIHRYSPEELQEYAEKQLGTVTLTDQQWESYGLPKEPS